MDTARGCNTDVTISSVTNHFLVDEMSYLGEDFSLFPYQSEVWWILGVAYATCNVSSEYRLKM